MNRIQVIIAAIIAVVICAVAGVAHHMSNRPTATREPQSNAISFLPVQPLPPPVPKILTKDPDYQKFLVEDLSDWGYAQLSPAYKARMLRIKEENDERTAGISDPGLRAQTESLAGTEITSEDIADGKQAFSDARLTVLKKHRTDWFEIGHVSYYSDHLAVHGLPASPVELREPLEVPFTVQQMDQVYTKFHAMISPHLDSEAAARAAGSSCAEQMKRACRNLGGSDSDCSEPEHLREIQDLGMDCGREITVDEARKNLEDRERDNRLVVVGEGDLVDHRVNKLWLVDYDTEAVLAELPITSFEAAAPEWRFPTR